MAFPWRQVLSAAATGGVALIPGAAPFSPLIVGTLNAALQSQPQGDLERWGEMLEDLEKNGRIKTNKARAMMMRAVIRMDVYKRTGAIPPTREVNWLLETLVMAYHGVTMAELDG